MEKKDLTEIGYPGYYAREDGWLENENGRLIMGNTNGQVKLRDSKGDYQWKFVTWLVCKAFHEQPAGYNYVAFRDGKRHHINKDNLVWSVVPQRTSKKKKALIDGIVNKGMTIVEAANHAECSVPYALRVVKERRQELAHLDQFLDLPEEDD